MRWAFKVAYFGDRFFGSQWQPGLGTVEGELIGLLQSASILRGPHESRFQVASRTDRGVHALGNVFAFDSERDPREIIGQVNRAASDVRLYAYAATREDFRPRWARERWYRYHLPSDLSLERLREAGVLFEGSHDFRSFAKGPSEGICTVSSLDFFHVGASVAMDVRADRFLRSMVRRIARALELHARGKLAMDALQDALRGSPLPLEPAAPERLFLMDVSYDFPFTIVETEHLSDRQRVQASRIPHTLHL